MREKLEKSACAAEISEDRRMLHCEACVDAFAALSNKGAYKLSVYVCVQKHTSCMYLDEVTQLYLIF